MTYTQILCLVFIALLVLWGAGQYRNSRPYRSFHAVVELWNRLAHLKAELSVRAPTLVLAIGDLPVTDALQEIRKAVGLPPANGWDSVSASIEEMRAHIIATDWRE